MGTEIERKFIVSEQPDWLAECPSDRIEQGYLAIERDTEVRLRRYGANLSLTVKRDHGRTRGEEEIKLSSEQFEMLWPLTDGRRLSKCRFRREAEEGTFEIDVYEGDLSGLLTAEIEFDDEAAADAFEPPDWITSEVTGIDDYANQSLAANGNPGGTAG